MMQQQPKRSRLGKFAVGALVGTIVSIGAASGAAQAQESADAETEATVSIVQSDRLGGGPIAMRMGIRW